MMEYYTDIRHHVGKGYLMRWKNAHDFFFLNKNNMLVLVLAKWQVKQPISKAKSGFWGPSLTNGQV